MRKANNNMAVLWSGGKDCCLAMRRAQESGHNVACLVTFGPPNSKFLAHPLELMRLQAQSLGVEHRLIEISEPYEAGYRRAIAHLAAEGVEALVTGDIAEVGGQSNWIRKCAEGSGLTVLTPLWNQSRDELMKEVLAGGFEVVITAVRTDVLGRQWLGVRLDENSLEALRQVRRGNGLDLCGENGEFHTMVLNGPGFARPVPMPRWSVGQQGPLAYMDCGPSEPVNQLTVNVVGTRE